MVQKILTPESVNRYERPTHMRELLERGMGGAKASTLLNAGREVAVVSRIETVDRLTRKAYNAKPGKHGHPAYDAVVRLTQEGEEGRRALVGMADQKENLKLASIAQQYLDIFFRHN